MENEHTENIFYLDLSMSISMVGQNFSLIHCFPHNKRPPKVRRKKKKNQKKRKKAANP